MKTPTNAYDSHYESANSPVQQAVRAATYGTDLGQTSWITATEAEQFLKQLVLSEGSRLLEVGCGSGGVGLFLVETSQASLVGIDINPRAVAAAMSRVESRVPAAQATFQVGDAGRPLPFADGSFDAILCNDSINHWSRRQQTLMEWHRVLRRNGRCLYTDSTVLTGQVSKEEAAARASMGAAALTPEGENEKLLAAAGFKLLEKMDHTEAMARVSERWLAARKQHQEELVSIEGKDVFHRQQDYLAVVSRLASERRLSRFAFLAEAS